MIVSDRIFVGGTVGGHGQKMAKLNVKKIDSLNVSGRYGDGNGLYLQVTDSGSKSWTFRYRIRKGGKKMDRQMGFGPYPLVSLSDARDLAMTAKRQLREGLDPIEQRNAQREGAKASPTFADCATDCVAALESGWRNDKHKAQWRSTLQTYALPVMGSISVDEIDTRHVLEVLQPIWASKAETARRLRGRIEAVLDYAKAKGLRHGENPARWRGHLNKLLSKPVKKVRHHPAMPYAEIGAFMAELRERDGIAAKAVEFTILTAVRSGETRFADWSEIDLEYALWVIPADRMKANREHRVPLSAAAVAVLEPLVEISDHKGLVFPGIKRGRPLSDMSLTAVLKRMGRAGLTMHGFRSSFRDWAGETTNFQRELAEAALAHAVGDQTERAYARGDALEKRRLLMEAWAAYCEEATEFGSVVPLRRP